MKTHLLAGPLALSLLMACGAENAAQAPTFSAASAREGGPEAKWAGAAEPNAGAPQGGDACLVGAQVPNADDEPSGEAMRAAAKLLVHDTAALPTFDDVYGAEQVKDTLQAFVAALRGLTASHPAGLRPVKGVLMAGPAGVGKTMLAKATARAADVNFISANGADLVLGMDRVAGPDLMRALFATARVHAPIVVFIDELDALTFGPYAKLLAALMDGFTANEGVYVLAAANELAGLPDALMRAGRFDRIAQLELPDAKARAAILASTPISAAHAADVDTDQLARLTEEMSGADLVNLSNLAGQRAADEARTTVTWADYDDAVDELLLGPVRPERTAAPGERERTAYHEAGHAILAGLLHGPGVVRKVSIVARGPVAGYTLFYGGSGGGGTNAAFLRSMATVAFGGRAAEEIVFGSFGVGGIADLDKATKLVRYMLAVQGMGAQTGPVGLSALAGPYPVPVPHSDGTKQRLDDEARQILTHQADLAAKLLRRCRPVLDALAQALLAQRTLPGEAVDALVAPALADILAEGKAAALQLRAHAPAAHE